MPDQFTNQSRAERAFTDLFAERAADAEFPPLDPASLVTPARRLPWWLGAGAAVAAVAIVVAIAVPLWNERAVTGVPAAPAPGVDGWQQTAPIPIGQRLEAVSLWAQGAFYVLGGHSHCGLDDQGRPLADAVCAASLPSRGESRADGARYDPATDTWTKIADAPLPIGSGQGVVVGQAIYVLSEPLAGHESRVVLHYDPAADTWTELPQPVDPQDRTIRQLLTWDGGLYAATVPADCAEHECPLVIHSWDATSNSWTQFASGHPALYYSAGATTLASTSDGFVSLTDTESAAFTADTAFELPPLPFEHPAAAYTVGSTVVAVSEDGQAYSLDLTDPVWLRRPPPTSGEGGLQGTNPWTSSARFFDGLHVVVRGQLLNPVADTWTDVPTLPNPDWSFGSFSGSGAQILACYVGPSDSMNDCYLLDL